MCKTNNCSCNEYPREEKEITKQPTPLTVDILKEKIGNIDTGAREPNTCFYKLVEEVGELGAMMRKDFRWDNTDETTIKNTLEEEIVDVLYYALMIAYLYNIDVEKSFRAKELLNVKKYNRESMF